MLYLLVGIVGFLIGYFLGRKSGRDSREAAVSSLSESNTRLLAELEACRKGPKTEPIPEADPASFDREAARKAFGRTVREDDLKLIEGIGPKIESLFHNFDIKTWRSLADTPVAKCQEVLDSGGDRYAIHDPASWPLQARMASEGRWKDLVRWQEEHKRGKL